MWFTPQPLLTLPSTSMRDNLALFIFTSTIRFYILPAVSTSTALVCGYCHGAPFAPSPGRLGGDAIAGSLSLRVAASGRGNRQHVSPDQHWQF